MKPVGIIILNWNGAALLRRYLPSVVAANSNDIADVVVADNGSTDESLSVLKQEFPDVRTLCFDKNYGYAEGYNRAIRELGYRYSVLLNSDVAATPEWIRPLYEYMEEHPEVAACQPKILSDADHTKFEYAGASGGFIDKHGYPFCRGRIFDTVETDNGQYNDITDIFWATGAALTVRTEEYLAAGGLDKDFFAHMEEIDLCWRMQLAGYRVRIVPRSRVYHLGGGTLQTDSPAKVFYNHRNNLAMLYKCASPAQRLCVAVARPALDLLASLSYLMQGRRDNFRAVFRAWRDFIRWHGALARKRREIRANRKGSAAENIYRGSVVLRYLFGRRTFGGMMR